MASRPDDVVRCLSRAGYRDVALHDFRGDRYWSAVSVASGIAVVARWRSRNWRQQQAISQELTSADPTSFPALLDTLEIDHGAIMIYKRVNGENLQDVLESKGGTMAYGDVVKLCERIARLVTFCHSRRVFVGTLTLRSFVFDQRNDNVILVDFPWAGRFGEPNTGCSDEAFIEYLAPEQTGRMGVMPTQVADLYSLGSVLYTIACGHPPFPLEAIEETSVSSLASYVRRLLHDRPTRPFEENAMVSSYLSTVIEKLLEKSPEDRYISAYGAWRDLEEAEHLHELTRSSSPTASTPRTLGTHDIPSQPEFTVTGRPYGRDAECQQIRDVFASGCKSKATLFCVKGGRGVGKSTLLRYLLSYRVRDASDRPGLDAKMLSELGSPPHHRQGSSQSQSVSSGEDRGGAVSVGSDREDGVDIFGPSSGSSNGSSSGNLRAEKPYLNCMVKCDSLHSMVPFFPVTSVLSGALRVLMACSAIARNTFTERLASALGPGLPIVVDAIPNLKHFCKPDALAGAGHPSADFSAEEAQVALRQALIDLIVCLSAATRPLLLIVDDIQGADAGTLLLFEQLARMKIDSGLLLVISETASPMADGGEGYRVCDKLAALCSWSVVNMTVNPMDVEGVTNLVQHVAHIPANECGSLALSLHNRTGGNPFRIVQLLRLMYENNALHFDMHAGRWTVDEDGLDHLSVHEGDDAAIQASIGSLSAESKHMLGVCACIGLTAALTVIATVAQKSVDEVYTALQPAMHKSFVVFDNRQNAAAYANVSDAITLVTGKKLRNVPISKLSPLSTATPTSPCDPPAFLLSDLSLRFLHEDVRTSCLKLLSPPVVASCHYGVAKWKAASITDEDDLKEHLFLLMARLQKCNANAMPQEQQWKWQYGQLFYEAASRARITSNFPEALEFALSGLEFLGVKLDEVLRGDPSSVPSVPPDLTSLTATLDTGCVLAPLAKFITVSPSLPRQLLIELALCKRLNGRTEAALTVFNVVLALSDSVLDRSEVYIHITSLLFVSGRIMDCIKQGLSCARELGLSENLCEMPDPPAAEAYFEKVLDNIELRQKQSGGTMLAMFTKTPLNDTLKLGRLHHTLVEISTPAFFVHPSYMSYFVCVVVEDALAHGITRWTPFALSGVAHAAGKCGRVPLMLELMDVTGVLVESVPGSRHRGRIRLHEAAYTSFYRQAPHTIMKALGPARSVCMSEGDLIYAAYVMFWKAYYGIYSPVPLKQVAEEAKQDWEYVKTTVFADGACLIASPMVDAFALMGSEAPITKQAIHAGYSSANLQFGVVLGAMGDAYTQYLLGKTEEAWQACRIAQDNIVGVKGFFTFGMQHAFRALIALKLERSGKGSSETQAAVQESRIVLERLSMEAPVTFGSWRCLVEAEASSSSPSSIISAIEFYDRSIELAGDTGLTNVQALAYELAGSFYLRNKGKLTALKLLRESLALYEAWGAFAVCNRIVVEFGSLDAASADESVLSKESIGSGSRGRGDLIRSQVSGSGHSSPPTLAQALDFDATLRFCQAISSQHSVSSLITEFRRTIGQCTNATRVAVLFPWDIFPEEARRPSTMPRPLAKSPTEPKHSLHASDGVSTLTSLSAQSVDTTDDEEFPESIVREAAVTREPIFVDFAMESRYCSDPYISEAQPKSLLAYPVYNNNALFCVVYLEQDDLRAAFSPRTLPVLNAISTQLAISHDALVSTEGLRASKLKLEELSKVKDRFLATLSHELKTPLHSMSMCLGLLNDTLLSAEQRSYLEVLQSSSMVLQRLLVDLMDLSKMRTGTLVLCPAPCSVQDLVLDVISNFQDQAANKNMETVYLTPGVLPKSVLMDAKRFKQLISVFVDNAVKFSRPGGMVEITLESFGMDGDGGRGNSAAQCLRVSVRDNTGPGIKPETRDQLFEPFSQLDTSDSRQFGGFGNGLALSKLIADQMRGAITVESDGFAGSRFTVELPVTVLDQSDVMDSLETAENALHGGPTPERMSEAILGSKSLVSYCKRFAASADVVGGVAREHGMSFERCMSREDLEAVLRDNRPRVHETAILVDEDTLAEVTRMHDSKAFSRVVLCLRRNGSIAPFPERTFPITIPVLKPVALSALRKCFPHRLPVSAPVSEVTSLESAEMPLLQPLPLLPLGPGESKGTATLPAPPLAPEAVVSEQKASPRPRKGSDGQPGQPQQSPLTQQHVLIVEDNLVNAKLLRNILKRNGYTSDIAENGAIGVEMARANEYCIILMDIQMPVMNGFDSTRNIRTFNFSVPIVAVSASLDDSEREACLAMGMTDVLMKPVVSSKLMAVVKALTPPSSVC